ncbi:hypothetical protein [Nonomuraea sp. NPDC050643]|uniref:hypothetical protein n=1 Tax=Nonomuraea sp. NPDC050643 TaxID=3155660 RepID=UPI0033E143D1
MRSITSTFHATDCRVRKGTYRQQVVIPADKPHITLAGDTRDPRQVVLTYDVSATTPRPDGSGPYGFLLYRGHLTSDAPARTVHLGRPWPAGGSVTARGQVLVRESWLGQQVKAAPWTDMSGLNWREARLSEHEARPRSGRQRRPPAAHHRTGQAVPAGEVPGQRRRRPPALTKAASPGGRLPRSDAATLSAQPAPLRVLASMSWTRKSF